jgi:hypothetical protein
VFSKGILLFCRSLLQLSALSAVLALYFSEIKIAQAASVKSASGKNVGKPKPSEDIEFSDADLLEPEMPPVKPEKPLLTEAAAYLKSSKEGISERVIILANEIDALFGNTRALNEYYSSTFVITQKSYLNTLGSGSYDIQSTLDLSLPNLRYTEERIRRWWSGLGGTEAEKEKEKKKVSKAEFKELNPWEFNQGSGARLSRPPAFNIHARASKNFLSKHFVHHFMEQVNWDSELLWQETTSLNSDFGLSEKLLFRFLNQADWGISDNKFGTTHGPSLIYSIDKVSATSFDIRMFNWTEENRLYLQKYTAGLTYRTNLHPLDWFFVQITPELSWPRTEDFRSVWTIYLTLDVVFGNKK